MGFEKIVYIWTTNKKIKLFLIYFTFHIPMFFSYLLMISLVADVASYTRGASRPENMTSLFDGILNVFLYLPAFKL